MEDWLKKELEYYNFRQKCAEEQTALLEVGSPNDFDIAQLERVQKIFFNAFSPEIAERCVSLRCSLRNVRSIVFSYTITTPITPGEVNEIVENFVSLNSISFTAEVDWEVIAAFSLQNIEKFTVIISAHPEKMALNAPKMKELTLFFRDGDETAKQFDFSNVNSIEKLKLSRSAGFNYEAICALCSLKELIIIDYSLKDLTWLSSVYQLETLLVSGKLTSVAGIETQHALKRIDLSRNAVTDIAPLLSLPHIEYLSLYGNMPEIHQLQFSNKNIPILILSIQDYEKEAIRRLFGGAIGSISYAAYDYIQMRDKPPKPGIAPIFVRKYEEWMALSQEEKIKRGIQQAFESTYFTINNKERFSKYRHYDISYKQLYLNMALERYPFLTISSEIEADYNEECGNL